MSVTTVIDHEYWDNGHGQPEHAPYCKCVRREIVTPDPTTPLDDFLTTPAPPHGKSRKRCIVGRALDDLDDTRRVKLDAMLADRDYTDAYLSKGLTAAGMRLSTSSVRNHRHAECACERNK